MTAFTAKHYQQAVLDSMEAFFRACHEFDTPSQAFHAVTEKLWGMGMAYHALRGFPADMPYFCLRIPTGGGKTWLAAKSLRLVNTHLLRSDYSVVLWLVPSRPILEQTINGLKDLKHPLHAALREAGPPTVLNLDEAKYVTRATLDTGNTIIVATRQAFQVEKEELRKVYESNGALMHHFEHLAEPQRAELLKENGTIPYSLANVLRLRRPFIIVDEAHNSRTDLGFDTLAKFRPGGIMELTATPDTEKTPSNILHSISASELKAEEMIKLPIRLETEPNWQQCLADAIARRSELHSLAETERRQGAAYLRPLVLIQAEPRRKGIATLDVDAVRQELINNHNIPAAEIVVATGEEKGLEAVEAEYKQGIADADCPIKFVITQKALAEGWDCPFAYILVSMASLQSATSVEQLLGRILRQPGASHRDNPLLNQSYAFVVSRNFAETANALRDRLVTGAGFERKNVTEFVQADKPTQAHLDYGKVQEKIKPVPVKLSQKPDLKPLPKPVKNKLKWESKTSSLTITEPLSPEETSELKATLNDIVDQQAVEQAVATITQQTQAALEHFQTPAEKGILLKIPQLAVYVQGELQLFDDPEALDYPWQLSLYDAHPSAEEVSQLSEALKVAEGGEIDVNAQGHVTTRFMQDLQRDLGLAYKPEHWDETRLGRWLCENLPDTQSTHDDKRAFVAAWLRHLLEREGFDSGRVNQQKFLIRTLLEQRIAALHKQAMSEAYQQTLFGENSAAAVNDSYAFTFNPQVYAPNRYYDPKTSKYGSYEFRHHYYPQIGDFDSKEEFFCACKLDEYAAQGKLKFWVRNPVRKENCSFFLQKADGRFYPDFICVLPDDKILVVEYKGADRWKNAEDDRAIGKLWAALSEDRCRFVMVKEMQWAWISGFLQP